MKEKTRLDFNSPLDEGIADYVILLDKFGVETYEYCEGGSGHAYPEPTIRFMVSQVRALGH